MLLWPVQLLQEAALQNLEIIQRPQARYEAVPTREIASPVVPLVPPSASCNVLIVSPHADEAEALVRMTTALGYKASSCLTSTEAIRIVAGDRSIGIVLAECETLPLGGLWIARELALRFALIRPVAVALCVRGTNTPDMIEALRANVADVLMGERTLEKVAASIRRAFGRWSEQAHLLRMNALIEGRRFGLQVDNDHRNPLGGNSAALDVARASAKIRRTRSKFFEPWVLASPTWDILLELALAALEGEIVSISSICALTEFPTSTALRHVRLLEVAGMISRETDQADRRRALLRIEPDALSTMQRYFEAARPALG